MKFYDFKPALVQQIVSESCEKMKGWLAGNKAIMGELHRQHKETSVDPLWWLRRRWPTED